MLGGDVSRFVHPVVVEALARRRSSAAGGLRRGA